MADFGKYESPAALLRDASLSHDQKVEMLEKWRDYKKALMRASDDGMVGEDPADLLSEIKKALKSLRDSSPG